MVIDTRGRRFVLVAVGLLAAYAIGASVLTSTKDFSDRGPLSYVEPALEAPLRGGLPLSEALARCFSSPDRSAFAYKVVGGVVRGHPYYACYESYRDGTGLFETVVVDAVSGDNVTDVGLIKAGGAWPYVGLVKSTGELVLGGMGLALLFAVFFLYYRRLRPGAPTTGVRAWQSSGAMVAMAVVASCVGWIALAVLPGVSRARKIRAALQAFLVTAVVVLGYLWLLYTTYPDLWGGAVLGLITGGYLYALLAGRRWLRPLGFGLPEDVLLGRTPMTPPPALRAPPFPGGGDGSAARAPPLTDTGSRADTAPKAGRRGDESDQTQFRVQRPGELPSFRQVGGMTDLKRELKDTFGLILAFADEAEQYRINWNGVLLHGPPGVGKTLLARAVAGEFGLNFISVTTGELVSAYRGDSARNLRAAFEAASVNRPCLLFFDEFDSIAQRRDDFPDQESRRTVNQLLQSLEKWRPVRELIVVAATNSLDSLDDAVTRPGRFDRHIRIDLPDAEARRAIFVAQLKDRPTSDELALDDLVRRSEGLTPAAIARTVEAAAIAAFRQATETGDVVHITTEQLIKAIKERGGTDRPTVEQWTWDQLVLPEDVKRELKQLQLIVRDPDRAQAFGVEAPSGVLLTGPPGTGKTTIAKILAAQSGCSFYPITPAAIISMWVGESEANIKRLFDRARENAPSIVFIDEIDALAAKRGDLTSGDRLVNQLLAEMDGVSPRRGVLVVAATNRPDQLDPAMLRGGRLSKTIEIGLPGDAARLRLLELNTESMPLFSVDLHSLAAQTEGKSGADLKALCQEAALQAIIRVGDVDVAPQVTAADFTAALLGSTGVPPGAEGYL